MVLGTANGLRVAQRRLQALAESLAEIDLEEEVDQAARLLRAELPALPDYSALDESHRVYYDLATGLRAAAALLSPALLRANDGLAKLKTPEFEYTFTVPSLAEREEWRREIGQAVGYLIKLVQSFSPPRQRARFSMFGAAGVTRRPGHSAGTLLRLFVPGEWMTELPLDAFGTEDVFPWDTEGRASEGDPVDNTGVSC